MVKPADGSGAERRVARLDRQIQEAVWSKDDQWFIVRTDNATTGAGDLLAVRASGEGPPVPLAASAFTELTPSLSPDGRWLAYASNESGTNEIYVRPFPEAASARFQVSNGGGQEPRWSTDGRELFFIDPASRLVAAQIRTAGGFTVTGITPLFSTAPFVRPGFHQSYVVTRDGRFLFNRVEQGSDGANLPLVEVTNWFADIRARLRP